MWKLCVTHNSFASQVKEAEEQEREKLDAIRQQEAALAAAKREAALAKWRRLQVWPCCFIAIAHCTVALPLLCCCITAGPSHVGQESF